MGKTGNDADARPVKMKKKSKKNKNVTSDLLNGGDLLKEKGEKHRVKKREFESNEDGHYKNNLVDDRGDSQKKRKRETKESEQGENDGPAVEKDCDLKLIKKKTADEKEKKKKKKKKEKTADRNSDAEINGIMTDESRDREENKRKKKKKKTADQNSDAEITGIMIEESRDTEENKGKKKKKKTADQHSDAEITGIMTEESRDREEKTGKKTKKKKQSADQNSDAEMNGIMTEESRDKKENKVKKKTNNLGKQKVKVKDSKVNNKSTETESTKSKGKSKRVSFSSDVEVFPPKETTEGDGLVRGKRFTPEEDEIVKEAVLNYITAHNLGDDGLKMVLNCNSHKGMKKCWQEIGTCIPYRPYTAVYYRAHILFERAETRSWTPEEIEFLKEFHEKHGNNWKMLAEELGKHRFHVKDTWRRIKLENLKGGKWSQEEYQTLYDLVNLDLQMKVNGQEKKSKHGMLRDNIPWTAVSEKLSTRSDATCCRKWYNQLTSSLVAEKKWCDGDDYRMIGALYELDAACVDDVDWDNLLEHRPGDICLKRWNQMVKHIGNNGCMPFSEQVDTLAKRYCPDLAETRDAWDKKPVVP